MPDAGVEMLVDQDPHYHEADGEAVLTPDAAKRLKECKALIKGWIRISMFPTSGI
jgi:hypothetical protein